MANVKIWVAIEEGKYLADAWDTHGYNSPSDGETHQLSMPADEAEKLLAKDPQKLKYSESAQLWKDNKKYLVKGKQANDKLQELARMSRFEEGVHADPTENMSEEDAQKWKDMNEEHRDNFKTAMEALNDLARGKTAAANTLSITGDFLGEYWPKAKAALEEGDKPTAARLINVIQTAYHYAVGMNESVVDLADTSDASWVVTMLSDALDRKEDHRLEGLVEKMETVAVPSWKTIMTKYRWQQGMSGDQIQRQAQSIFAQGFALSKQTGKKIMAIFFDKGPQVAQAVLDKAQARRSRMAADPMAELENMVTASDWTPPKLNAALASKIIKTIRKRDLIFYGKPEDTREAIMAGVLEGMQFNQKVQINHAVRDWVASLGEAELGVMARLIFSGINKTAGDPMSELEMLAEGCPDNLDDGECKEWEANTEKYKDVVKDQHKSAATRSQTIKAISTFITNSSPLRSAWKQLLQDVGGDTESLSESIGYVVITEKKVQQDMPHKKMPRLEKLLWAQDQLSKVSSKQATDADLVTLTKMAMEFDSPEALKKYLHEHPDADRSKHHVKKQDGGSGKDDEGESKEVSLSREGYKSIADLLEPFNEPGPWGHVVTYAVSGKPMEAKHVKSVVKDIDGYLRSWGTIAKSYGWDDKDKKNLTKAKGILEKQMGGKKTAGPNPLDPTSTWDEGEIDWEDDPRDHDSEGSMIPGLQDRKADGLMSELEDMVAEGCPDNLDDGECKEWEANTEKYKDVVKDQHKAATWDEGEVDEDNPRDHPGEGSLIPGLLERKGSKTAGFSYASDDAYFSFVGNKTSFNRDTIDAIRDLEIPFKDDEGEDHDPENMIDVRDVKYSGALTRGQELQGLQRETVIRVTFPRGSLRDVDKVIKALGKKEGFVVEYLPAFRAPKAVQGIAPKQKSKIPAWSRFRGAGLNPDERKFSAWLSDMSTSELRSFARSNPTEADLREHNVTAQGWKHALFDALTTHRTASGQDGLLADLEMLAEGCPDNLDDSECKEWEANTEKYKDVVKDQHKTAMYEEGEWGEAMIYGNKERHGSFFLTTFAFGSLGPLDDKRLLHWLETTVPEATSGIINPRQHKSEDDGVLTVWWGYDSEEAEQRLGDVWYIGDLMEEAFIKAARGLGLSKIKKLNHAADVAPFVAKHMPNVPKFDPKAVVVETLVNGAEHMDGNDIQHTLTSALPDANKVAIFSLIEDWLDNQGNYANMNTKEQFAGKLFDKYLRGKTAKVAMEFDSPEALKKYLHEHPDADRSKHYVKKEDHEWRFQTGTKPTVQKSVKKWIGDKSDDELDDLQDLLDGASSAGGSRKQFQENHPETKDWTAKDFDNASVAITFHLSKNMTNNSGKHAAVTPAGLYGFTRSVQSSCESSIRKMTRMASQIAKAAYQQDENTAPFLAAHAKRANSLSAKILVAALKGLGPKVASQIRLAELRVASEDANQVDKVAARKFGLYGYPAKTAKLGLNACTNLREAAGTTASDLHGRKAAAHKLITGFLKEHSKQGKCLYAKMLYSSYPDSDRKTASTNDDWIAWAA